MKTNTNTFQSGQMPSLRLFFLYMSVVFSATISGTAYGQDGLIRKTTNMDSDWKFHLGNAADPAKDFNFKTVNIFSKSGRAEGTPMDVKFNDSTWRTLQLPHDWAVELPFEDSGNADVMSHGYRPVGGLYPQNSIGWYRKHFAVARADSGRRYAIRFDGIFRNSSVWLNGFYLGTHESGYTGSTYDLTDYLNFKKDNVLVVRVDASQYEGWFYEGAGIYRHAWLLEYPEVHITADEIFAHADVVGTTASITVEGPIENHGLLSGSGTAYIYVADPFGKIIAQGPAQLFSVKPFERFVLKEILKINNPMLWSLEKTNRYTAGVVIRQGDKTLDRATARFGIRTIAFDKEKGLILNGKEVKVYGVNCHQDHAGVGSALPDYLQYYRIRLLKEMGANAYRTSHNPPTPELLEACDSLGMLVMDENRLINSGQEYMKQWEQLILRDRNHPSIFMWSIGNEEGYIHTNSYGKRLAQTLLAKQKMLDPSRTATYAADLANVFPGINEVIPVRGFNYRIMGVDPYHKDHPDQPIIGTEMGSTVTTRGIYTKDTVAAYVPDEDITYMWWSTTAEQWWTLCAERPWYIGGFVWTGFDYRGEPTPYKWPNVNSHFGLMDVCGFPKNIYYYYQSWWTDRDVLHISPHWNWKGKEGQPINVWVNTNADNVELFLNGKSQGKKDMPRNKHLEWNIPYEPGRLEAIAFKKGRKITASVETTADAAEVAIIPFKTTIIADGKDATVINVRVIDRQGRDIPDANQSIEFSVTGDAKFIGVGNGDPSSHEADQCMDGHWHRKLFNGRCQIILQAGKSSGIIKVTAKSNGLEAASSEIHAIRPVAARTNTVSAGKALYAIRKSTEKMLGADISFLPQLEDRGIVFRDKGVQKDAIAILKDHGFNYVRLRIFENPSLEKGYSPQKGFCDLEHTKQMALRAKKAGMKLLLDFHYSDYWADPQQQYKPYAWKDMGFPQLTQAVQSYTKSVMMALKDQGTVPDMVQIGNEINHGMIWPEGHVRKMDSLAQLIKAGIKGVKEADPSVQIMMHVALGGQNDEARFWLDNMLSRGVQFDVIGLSYYPRWHGTLEDLRNNMIDLAGRYEQEINLVEYSQLKQAVNDIVFNLPGNKGTGSCIWEPLNTWESIFDKDGNSKDLISVYDGIRKAYIDRP